MSLRQSVSVLVFLLGVSFAVHPEESQHDKEAKQLMQQYAKTLKLSLTSAIKTGGLKSGVEVCSKQAPEIAKSLSVDGWQVSRISLKPRNAGNKPVAWQQSILSKFEQQKAAGTPINELVFREQNDNNYMMVKAIETGELCLKCHGKTIDPALQETITHLYPDDKATGFSTGDIRGAFVIQKTFVSDKADNFHQ